MWTYGASKTQKPRHERQGSAATAAIAVATTTPALPRMRLTQAYQMSLPHRAIRLVTVLARPGRARASGSAPLPNTCDPCMNPDPNTNTIVCPSQSPETPATFQEMGHHTRKPDEESIMDPPVFSLFSFPFCFGLVGLSLGSPFPAAHPIFP